MSTYAIRSELIEEEAAASSALSALLGALEPGGDASTALAKLELFEGRIALLALLLSAAPASDEMEAQLEHWRRRLPELRVRVASQSAAAAHALDSPPPEGVASAFLRRVGGNSGGNSGDGSASNNLRVTRSPSATSAPSRAPPARAGPRDAGMTSLRHTRAALSREVERMAALGDVLATDASTMRQADAEHDGIASEIEEAKRRIRLIKTRNTQDCFVIAFAALALVIVVAYIITARILWNVASVRI